MGNIQNPHPLAGCCTSDDIYMFRDVCFLKVAVLEVSVEE